MVAVAEALWARYVRTKINDGEIGDGPGWLHPLAVARSVVVAKASAWVGALVLGWWVGVLVYLPAAAVMAAGRGRGHRRAPSWPPSARWRWWSPRCGCSIAANLRQDPTERGEGAES